MTGNKGVGTPLAVPSTSAITSHYSAPRHAPNMKCDICGTEHEPHVAHRFAPAPNKEIAPNIPNNATISAPNRSSEWKRQNRERYNAYMKGYMRRRRGEP